MSTPKTLLLSPFLLKSCDQKLIQKVYHPAPIHTYNETGYHPAPTFIYWEETGYHAGMRWLSRLLDLLLPSRRTSALVRDASPETFASLVSPLTIPSRPFPTTALLPYRNPLVQALVIELKFHKNTNALPLLAGVLREYLLEYLAEQEAYEKRAYALIPVPLSSARKKARGYNQVEELWKAAGLSEYFRYIPDALVRVRDTVSQTSLTGKERLSNMHGAFQITVPLDSSVTYILLDDVTTTGATLQAAVDALMKGGAQHVVPLALAH